MRVRPTRRLVALALPGALLLGLGLRFSLQQDFGSDLPFHDQWDAEALLLLRPWKGGGNILPFIFRFHNEHHPVLTKLIALALAAYDGMWSALPQLVLNTFFQGVIIVLIARLARRHLAPRPAWLVTVTAAVALSLPLLWENMLWGFQSQFYLAILLGLLHLDLTWSTPRLGWRWVLGAVAGVLTLGTFAAGFLSVLAGGLVALTRLRRSGPELRHALATLAVAAAVTAAGFALINPVPYPAVAHNSFSAVEAYVVLAGWPFNSGAAVFLMQFPALLFLAGQCMRAGERPSQPWLTALVLWLVAATAAFAFGRAELINGATPRYRDFLVVQCLVGLVCLLQFATAQTQRRRLGWIVAGLWIAGAGLGFLTALRSENLNRELATRVAVQSAQRELVRAFELTDDARLLDSSEPSRLIHDSAEQRLSLLRDRGIRSLLPPSVRSPLPVTAAAESRGFVPRAFVAADLLSPGWNLTPESSRDAYFLSDLIKPEPYPLLRFRVGGGVDGQAHRLRLLVGPEAKPLEPLAWTHGEAGQFINFPMPAGPFRIEAAAAAGSPSLSFSAPVSLSRLSWLSGKILSTHFYCTLAGIVLLGLAGIGAWTGEPVAPETESKPALSGRRRALAALASLVLLAVGAAGWPHPLVVGSAARNRLLLDPGTWSARAAGYFQLSSVEPGDGIALPGHVYNAIDSPESYFGTYGPGGDADTARAVSSAFDLDANWLCVPIVGYPAQPANSLALEFLDRTGEVRETVRYSGANPAEQAQLWLIDVSAHRGQRARVRCVDGETGHLGWLGLATPWLLDDPAVVGSWQRLADSNRLLWLRPCLLLAGLLLVPAWLRSSHRETATGGRAAWLWP